MEKSGRILLRNTSAGRQRRQTGEMSVQLFRSPLFQVIAKQFLVGRYVFGDRNRQPGVIEELPPVNVVGGHIAGPGSTAERVGGRLTIEPASAVGR